MAFDPDAYLADGSGAVATSPAPAPKFDPDAYLAAPTVAPAKPAAFNPDAYLATTAPAPATPPKATTPPPVAAPAVPPALPAQSSISAISPEQFDAAAAAAKEAENPTWLHSPLARLRQELSPILGETTAQTLKRESDQKWLERNLPSVAGHIEDQPGFQKAQQRAQGGLVTALDQATAVAPGTPQIPMIPKQEGTAAQIGAGAVNAVTGVLNSLAGPKAIAIPGTLGARAMQLLLAPLMFKGGVESVKTLVDPKASVQDKATAATNVALLAVPAVEAVRKGAAALKGEVPKPAETPPPADAGQSGAGQDLASTKAPADPPPGRVAPVTDTPGAKTRGFVDHVQDSPDVAPETKALVQGLYQPQARAAATAQAGALVDKVLAARPATGLAEIKDAWMSSQDAPTAESWALGLELARRFDAAGEHQHAADVLNRIAQQATTPARALSYLNVLPRVSTEAIGLNLTRQAAEKGVTWNGFSAAERAELARLQEAARTAGSPETQLARQAELFQWVNDRIPIGAMDKLARTVPLSLIMHPKVFFKKAVGDISQFVLRTAADNLVPALDKGFSVITGRGRTRSWVSMADQLKGLGQPAADFMAGVRDAGNQGLYARQAVQLGLKTMFTNARLATRAAFMDQVADVRQSLRHTYSSKLGRAAEDFVGTAIGLPTRAFYMRAFQSRLANEMKTATLNGQELLAPSADMVDRAHLAGAEAVFSHDNPFSRALGDVRKTANLRQPLGVGTAIAPLTKVPGGIVDMAVRYSPLGFVRAAYKGGLANVLGRPEAVDRGAALDAFTQAAMGSAGLVGTGYWLAKNGIITGAAEQNKDAEAVRQAAGFGKYSINLSALKRMMVSGKWDTPDHGQPGDITTNYNWLQPVGLGLAMGAEGWHQGQEAKRQAQTRGIVNSAGAAGIGLVGAAKSLEDLELFTGLSRFGTAVGRDGVISGTLQQGLNLPAMLVPSIFRDVRNLSDNTVRQLSVSDPVKTALDRTTERMPGIAEAMGFPPQRDRFGQAIQRYDVGSNGWLNVLANPTYLRTLKADPVGQEVMRLFTAGAGTEQLPRAAPYTAEIHNFAGKVQQVTLTPQQISDMQQWTGTITHGLYMQFMQNPAYLKMPDDEKAKTLARMQTSVHEAAKRIILGDYPVDGNGQVRDTNRTETNVILRALKNVDLGPRTAAGLRGYLAPVTGR